MSQDDFVVVSSRTFVSSIERGNKSPTVEKLSDLAVAMRTEAAVVVLLASLLEAVDPDTKLAEICAAARLLLSAPDDVTGKVGRPSLQPKKLRRN
jgi:transcriptional regulator with XRE-family HTH domain